MTVFRQRMNQKLRDFGSILERLFLGLLQVYRFFFSPFLHFLAGPGFGCRFLPSCSEYCGDAFQLHGWLRGSFLSILRISRCHPFAEAGYDPVPHAIGKTLNSHLIRR